MVNRSRLFLSLSGVALLSVILILSPHSVSGRAQATMSMTMDATMAATRNIPACAGLQTTNMGNMPTQAATMDMPMLLSTAQAATMQLTSAATMDNMNAPSIRIIAPAEGDTVSNPISVRVAVTGITITAGTHLHIYLDGQIAVMGYDTSIQLVNVPPGIHDVCVVIADMAHNDTPLKDGVRIIVEAATKTP